LFFVIEALGSDSALFGFVQSGQEQRGENCDDRDDDEEFDQGKGWPAARETGLFFHINSCNLIQTIANPVESLPWQLGRIST
jgi:hypothetical protein